MLTCHSGQFDETSTYSIMAWKASKSQFKRPTWKQRIRTIFSSVLRTAFASGPLLIVRHGLIFTTNASSFQVNAWMEGNPETVDIPTAVRVKPVDGFHHRSCSTGADFYVVSIKVRLDMKTQKTKGMLIASSRFQEEFLHQFLKWEASKTQTQSTETWSLWKRNIVISWIEM